MDPTKPDARITRAAEVVTFIVGPAVVGGDAWEAILRSVIGGRTDGTVMEDREQARARVVVAWIGGGGEPGKSASSV